MSKTIAACLLAMCLALSGSAFALDTSKPILCASIDVHECVDGGSCREVLAEDVNAPTFIRIDLKKKTVAGRKSVDPDRIKTIESVDGRLIMQGLGVTDAEDLGWTIVVEEDTGRMIVTATTEQAAVVIFGACTEN